MKNKQVNSPIKEIKEYEEELKKLKRTTELVRKETAQVAVTWSRDLVDFIGSTDQSSNSTRKEDNAKFWVELNKQREKIDSALGKISVLEQKIQDSDLISEDKTNLLEETIVSTTTRSDIGDKEVYFNDTKRVTVKKKKKINLFSTPTGKFKEGDKVRILNSYSGRYGNLLGKIGTVNTIGKTFIFIDIPGIPETQQRTENNLELVK